MNNADKARMLIAATLLERDYVETAIEAEFAAISTVEALVAAGLIADDEPEAMLGLAQAVKDYQSCGWARAMSMIAEGKISVNGEVTTDPDFLLATGRGIVVQSDDEVYFSSFVV